MCTDVLMQSEHARGSMCLLDACQCKSEGEAGRVLTNKGGSSDLQSNHELPGNDSCFF